MSFFEPPPQPPEPPHAPAPMPDWYGPPDNVWPASFPLDVVLARTDDLALFVRSGRAYEQGFEFTLELRRRTPLDGHGHDPMMLWHAAHGGPIDDDALRFGIAFADGRKATVFDRHPWWSGAEDPPAPDIVLVQRGGGGGGTGWSFQFWAWPLPPEGPMEFVVEWPSEGLELTRAELDSTVVRDAATRAMTLWPNAEAPGGSVGAWTRRL